ncbi:hypothetical protein [Bradyrhizobium ganzhouense]|uniref:hypothetical protein n=1 Tax=Bradyrhizobium ganzhouense TaxID=1179767 RepID=UPI003CF15A5C
MTVFFAESGACAAIKAVYDSAFSAVKMDTLGITLIVVGAGFLCGGLFFLLPAEGRATSSQKSVEESLEEIEAYLRRIRKERGDLS